MSKTTSETMLMHHQNVFIAEQLFSQQKLSLSELGEVIPGYLQVNNKDDLALRYVNDSGAEQFDLSAAEIIAMGAGFFERYIHPDTIQRTFPKFHSFCSKGDDHATFGEFQYIRNRTNSDCYEWFLTIVKFSSKFDCLIGITHPLACFEGHARKIAKLLDDNFFLRQHYEQFASLTKMEKEILRLLALGHRNKDIAEQFFISPHTVRTHRNNIHSKLDICGKHINHATLYVQFAEAFGLV